MQIRSLMNGRNGVAMASVRSFMARIASITAVMSVITGNPQACDSRSASSFANPGPARDDRRHAALIDHLDVEICQLLGGALHALDRVLHVVVGQLLDRQRNAGDIDALGRDLVPFPDRARRNRRRKNDADMQSPAGNAYAHDACSRY